MSSKEEKADTARSFWEQPVPYTEDGVIDWGMLEDSMMSTTEPVCETPKAATFGEARLSEAAPFLRRSAKLRGRPSSTSW